jgi:hypothetical protein
MDSLDEISISADTRISELDNGTIRSYFIKPEDFQIKRSALGDITGGDPQRNAEMIRAVLSGEKGPPRDIVLLNAAFAIAASGLAHSPHEGFRAPEESRSILGAGRISWIHWWNLQTVKYTPYCHPSGRPLGGKILSGWTKREIRFVSGSSFHPSLLFHKYLTLFR